jgi:hypothetical protein
MENHENNGHGESHGDHATEGNRQYYPKGWWMPLIGLLVVALGFTTIGYFAFNVSGTDKWGKKEQCEMKEGKECCDDEKECKEGEHGKSEGKENKDGEHAKGESKSEGAMAPTGGSTDSVAAKPAELKKVEDEAHH